MTTVKESSVQMVLDQTVDAYSRSRYGEAAWKTAAVLLLDRGCSVIETIMVMNSKWMRWAADAFGEFDHESEILTGNEIIQYMNKYDMLGTNIAKELA